jgi:hypothetical protein
MNKDEKIRVLAMTDDGFREFTTTPAQLEKLHNDTKFITDLLPPPDGCKHEHIVPYGEDGEFGKCTDCGDDSFSMYDPEKLPATTQTLINLPVAARLRVLKYFCFYCGEEAPDGCNCMRDE